MFLLFDSGLGIGFFFFFFQYGCCILKILSFKWKGGKSDENVVLPSTFPFWELELEIFRL